MSHKHPLLLVTMALGLLGIGVIHVQSQEKYSGLSPDTIAADTVVGCIAAEETWRLIELADTDQAAAVVYLQPRVNIGFCRFIDKGTRIAIEHKILAADAPDPTLGNWYCARPYGDPQCYWVMHVVTKEN
jgi:hypothetical protein